MLAPGVSSNSACQTASKHLPQMPQECICMPQLQMALQSLDSEGTACFFLNLDSIQLSWVPNDVDTTTTLDNRKPSKEHSNPIYASPVTSFYFLTLYNK